MKLGDYETHPIADAFPILQGSDFELLKLDVKDKGLLDKDLWLHKGKILDGRNRYKVCLELGIKPKWREYEGDDPIGFALSRNFVRRNMNESQRAMVACRLAAMKPGRPKKTGNGAGLLTQAQAAAALNVGERTVREARAVLKSAASEVLAAVERGDITLAAAAELATMPPNEQRKLLEEALGSADTRRGRDRVVRHQTNRAGDEKRDPMETLLRAFMRAASELGASASLLPTTNGSAILIGFRGQEITVTLSARQDAELVA